MTDILSLNKGVVGFDIETAYFVDEKSKKKSHDPSVWEDRLLSIQLSTGVPGEEIILLDNFDRAIPILTNPDVLKVGHNLKFEALFMLHNLGIDLNNIWDTMIIERLLKMGLPHQMQDNSLAYTLNNRMGVTLRKEIRDQFRNHTGPMTPEQIEYAMEDVRYMPELYKLQLRDVEKLQLGRVVSLEHKILPITARMQYDGVLIDVGLWDSFDEVFRNKINSIKKSMADTLGLQYTLDASGEGVLLDENEKFFSRIPATSKKPEKVRKFNPNSYDQLAVIYVEVLSSWYKDLGKKLSHLPVYAYINKDKQFQTDTGKLSTGESVRRLFSECHPIFDLMEEYSHWKMLRGRNFPKHINKHTGRLHPQWKQLGAVTGRFSSSKPGLQNVSRPTPGEPNVRNIFIPDPGNVFIVADYAQQEPRIYAHMCKDPKFIDACNESDIYLEFAKYFYGETITKDDHRRFLMKTGVLATGYKVGSKSLSETLGCSVQEADMFIAQVFNTFPGMVTWMNSTIRDVMYHGYTKTLLGRRRFWHIDDYKRVNPETGNNRLWILEKEAVNMPIQGTAADMMKSGMVALWENEELKKYNMKIVLQIHDELVIQCPKEYGNQVAELVQNILEQTGNTMCPDVKLPAEAFILDRWDKV